MNCETPVAAKQSLVAVDQRPRPLYSGWWPPLIAAHRPQDPKTSHQTLRLIGKPRGSHAELLATSFSDQATYMLCPNEYH